MHMNTTLEKDKAPAAVVPAIPAAEHAHDAKPSPAPAVAKDAETRVAQIKAAATTLSTIEGLSVELKEFGAGSFVLRAPSFKEAVKALPKSDEAKQALALVRGLQEAVEGLTGDSKRTWVFHRSGSFALYSRLQ